MVYAAELALATGHADEELVARTRRILESLGLPHLLQKADAWPQLLEAMRRDKKARGNLLRFIILDGLARPRLEVPDDSILRYLPGDYLRVGLSPIQSPPRTRRTTANI